MSSFRSIRPSSSSTHKIHQPDDSTPLSPPFQREESSTAPHQSGGLVKSGVVVGQQRKRKPPAHVSQNACTNCKKARAKCDGSEGSACTRCIGRKVAHQCQYELHLKTAKEELIRKIRELEQANTDLIAALKEKDRWIENVVDLTMRSGNGAESLEHMKESGQPYRELLEVLNNPPLDHSQYRHDSGSSIDSTHYTDDVTMDSDEDTNLRWTSVTTDEARVHHLMALYFCWVHPVHMLFSERHFMGSYRNKNKTYCTNALINAICALGCCYEEDEQGNNAAGKRLGERFAQQVLTETKNEARMTPVSAVTYAILFLVELSAGKGAKAFSHLRLAVESLHEVEVGRWSEEAFEITSFGIHTLNTAWSAFTYQKPAAPLSPHTRVFVKVNLDKPDAYWQSYRFPKDSAKESIPGVAIETAKEFAKLSQINYQVIRGWCGSQGKVTAQLILQLYRRYISWKSSLPDHLTRLEFTAETAPEALPHIFSLHIQYNVAICQLFVPLLECKTFSAGAMDHIRGLCVQSARQGLSLCERYRILFSNRYQPPLQAFCLLHLCDVILRVGKQGKPDVALMVKFCLEMLSESLPGFPMVGPLQAMFCESVLSCGYKLPSNTEQLMGGRSWQSFSREDKLECCERLTYAQPVDMLVERLDPNISRVFEEQWNETIENHGGSDDDDTLLADDSV